MARLESLRLPRRRRRESHAWRRVRWTLLGLVVVAITLVVQLPAAWLADSVATRTGQRVLLADAAGTIWHGSATLALSAGAGSQTATVLPGRLTWAVSGWPLLQDTLRVVVSHDRALAAPVALTVTPRRWTVQTGAISLPASLLEGVGAPFNTLRPDGQMRLDWSGLQGRFADGTREGHLTLRIEQVSSAVSRLRPLGSYRAEIDWTGAAGRMELKTLAGPLYLEGSGTLGRQARFTGTAHADPEAAAQLAGLLSLLGRREDNVTRLNF